MKRITSMAAIALTALVTLSCEGSGFNEADFVTTITDVCLMVDGKTVMEYDNSIHQLAWSERDLQFRMMDDSVNNYFVVNLSKVPSEMGEQIQAEVLYTTNNSVRTVSGTFNASKISSTSSSTTIWLWNESADVAAVIQILR